MDCPSDKLVELVLSLRDEENFDLLVDLTAIDHGEEAQVRFSVVLHFYSLVQRGYLALSVACPDNENPSVPSIAEVYPAANWHERETYDMFGIKFEDILISDASSCGTNTLISLFARSFLWLESIPRCRRPAWPRSRRHPSSPLR